MIALVTPNVPALIMESNVKVKVVCTAIVDETKLVTLIVLVAELAVQVGVELEVISMRENAHF